MARPVVLSGALVIFLPASFAAAPPTAPSLGLGYEYDLSGAREEFLLPDPLLDPSIAPDHPLYVRIRAPWALLEPAPGQYDWSEVDRIADPYREANFVVILCLYGTNPAIDQSGGVPTAGNAPLLKAWLEFARAAGLHFKGRVKYYQVWDEPNREPQWTADKISEFGYVLKNTSVTIRSADPGALIAQGSLAAGVESLDADLAWQEALYRQEIATYVDALEVHPAPGAPLDRTVARAYDLLLDHDPSAQLWTGRVPVLGSSDKERATHLIEQFIVGQGEGSAIVLFDLEADVEGQPEFPAVLLDLHKLFIPTYTRVPGRRLAFEPYEGGAGGQIEGVTSYVFFDADAFQGLVGFFTRTPPEEGKARMVIDTAAVRGVVVYDIIGGAAGPVRKIDPDFKANTTRVPVFLYDRPQVLQYARVPIKGFEAEKEEVQIRETGLITAEEVIAGHQAFMADQKYRLGNYRAGALLTYHGKIAGSNTVDVSIDNAFFWDRSTGAEWEQRALYYNGVLWKGKKLPELPIPQPEKVFTLPLDINLNKDYTYEYAGREHVGEFDCYVLDFKPIDRSRVLYEGRAWIETRTFAPVKTSTVQLNLEPPLISNEEQDLYAPVTGPDGATYWLLSRVEGQQILAVAGQNLVLLREVDFKEFRINDSGFEQARQEAYRSERQMLRDTEKGLRYLQRTEEGERVVKEGTAKSALLGLAGLYRQPGLDLTVLPLVGAGYFNFDFRGRDIQMTALLGGAVNLFSLTDPHVLGRRLDASLQVVTFAVNVTDRLFIQGKEREESDIDARSQFLSGSLGLPLGNFVRVKATYGLEYINYGADEETDTFVTPSDTLIQSPGISWEFNRAAWTIAASGQRSYRSRWEPWGDAGPATDPEILGEFPLTPCDSPGSCFDAFDPEQKDYDRYEFSVARQFFLPLFQKLRFEASWQAGSRLDRFSEFQFSFFGNRVRGFSGSGIRYDRGGIARAQYAFNIANVVRFDASLDHAYVRDSLTSDSYQKFTGFGISGNMMGPWETVLQFDVGVAIQSDFEDLRGETEFQVGLLKYF
ncbi:MAG: hypothetical protein HY613_09175 [Candidatus Rokubacteria bacterium]|nr:hypothetical protein [Candidatus Rokubacteria bacterium]